MIYGLGITILSDISNVKTKTIEPIKIINKFCRIIPLHISLHFNYSSILQQLIQLFGVQEIKLPVGFYEI